MSLSVSVCCTVYLFICSSSLKIAKSLVRWGQLNYSMMVWALSDSFALPDALPDMQVLDGEQNASADVHDSLLFFFSSDGKAAFIPCNNISSHDTLNGFSIKNKSSGS